MIRQPYADCVTTTHTCPPAVDAADPCWCDCHVPDLTTLGVMLAPFPRSECRVCPAYVVRCAHLEGDERVLWIGDNVAFAATPCTGWRRHGVNGPRYEVVLGIPQYLEREDCLFPYFAPDEGVTTATRAEADAAFKRYEAILLGRAVEA